ncbi:hypothetical protein AB6A40_000016 [Gnathostoma spinigerum]|uniref:[histone H3]-trimethyl-L-lysine(4) demethylase n=1 Tax=Gnathostoma spinigerum TaxID=75299 RepID=A0ABD6E9E6_9BILA
MNRSFEKYYHHFERPPFAPTYCPTPEEFSDPVAYIAKIRPHAEKFGVVKIKPPASFRPPFIINPDNFEFTPRIQKLNQLEGLTRSHMIFDAQIATYWNLSGRPFKIPYVANKVVNLYRLNKAVKDGGGADAVTESKRWSTIGKYLGFGGANGSALKAVYYKWIDPVDKALSASETSKEAAISNSADCKPTMQGRRRAPVRRRASTLTTTVKTKQPRMHNADEYSKADEEIDEIKCVICGMGNFEEQLLMCEVCDLPQHTFCCEPALVSVPKGEWRCNKCAGAAARDIATSVGFYDDLQRFTLKSFENYAHEWKNQYFNHSSNSNKPVPCEAVENEFWKKVIDMDDTVEVKYGADLLASTVGSGFPMPDTKCENATGFNEIDYYTYQKHPWNLNNMPVLKDSVLCFIQSHISGMMVPWVYVGMCFSAFCWHTEDHWTYSVNYMHRGERKIWYGVSGLDGEKFDDVMKSLVPDLFQRQPDLMHHMTTIINPDVLISRGIKVYTVHQEPGDFVITFPRAYHAGYNEGFNVAEAVNFAPCDWLRNGRMCVSHYASVRRNCVFAHDELVLLMAEDPDKMELNMCLSVLHELHELSARETILRDELVKHGVLKCSREFFEKMTDDERTCKVCRTTVFVSGVLCAHGHLACLPCFCESSARICSACLSPDCFTFKYRYQLDELIPLIENLDKKTETYRNFRSKMTHFLDVKSEEKPALEDVMSLMQIGRKLKITSCDVMERAVRALKQYESVSHMVANLTSRKIRTRSNDRLSNTDAVQISDIATLKANIDALPFDTSKMSSTVTSVLEKITNWQKRCADILQRSKTTTDSKEIDSLGEFLNETDDFNVKIPEKESLLQLCCRSRWLIRAQKLLRWNDLSVDLVDSGFCKNEGDKEDEENKEWTLQSLMSLIDEGTALKNNEEEVEKTLSALHNLMKIGYRNEHTAESIMMDDKSEGIGVEAAEARWNDLEKTDWMNEINYNNLRDEVERAQSIRDTFSEIKSNESDNSLKKMQTIFSKCSHSLFVRRSAMEDEIRELRDSLLSFVNCAQQLFVRPLSYYCWTEILMGRTDVNGLCEGDILPLHRFVSSASHDSWSSIDRFKSSEALNEHLKSIDRQSLPILSKLRKLNGERSVNETCCCSSEKFVEDRKIITCMLCSAKFHVCCVRWNDFLNRLPIGYYVCVRCARGRRPPIDEVRLCLASAPPSLERTLVNSALNRTQSAYEEMEIVFNEYSSSSVPVNGSVIERFTAAFLKILNCEIINLDVWSSVMPVLPNIFPLEPSMCGICESIRGRFASGEDPLVLFAGKTSGRPRNISKRSRPSVKVTCTFRSRRSRELCENDFETCSADVCLNPFCEKVRWIQCEGNCLQWFHYACVGITIESVSQKSPFLCHRCSQNELPTSGIEENCSNYSQKVDCQVEQNL